MTPEDIRKRPAETVGEDTRETYLRDGAVCIERAIGDDWLAKLRAGVDRLVEIGRASCRERV